MKKLTILFSPHSPFLVAQKAELKKKFLKLPKEKKATVAVSFLGIDFSISIQQQ